MAVRAPGECATSATGVRRLCSSGSSAAVRAESFRSRAAAKVIEGASFAELLEHGRAHVRRARDGRVLPSSSPTPPHRRCDRPRRVGLRRRRAMLGQGDRRREAPAPRRKSFAVNPPPRCSARYSFRSGAVRLRRPPSSSNRNRRDPPGRPTQLLDRVCELGIDERRPDERAVLGAEREPQPRPAHVDVTLAQRGHPVGPGAAGVGLRADPEPGSVDQRHGVGERPLGAERLAEDVARHRCPQPWQKLAEAHEAVVLRAAPAPPGSRGDRGTAAARPRRCPLPGASQPGLGEIHTSCQAGGMTSSSIRASFAGSVIVAPRASSYRNRFLPRRRQPPRRGIVSRPFAVCTRRHGSCAGSSIRGLRRADATDRAPEPR